MKKFLFSMLLMLSMIVSASAQIATQNATFIDNTYITLNAGASTPLNFEAVFPVNPSAGLAIGKWFTPVWGAEVEGTAWFGSHGPGGSAARLDGDIHNAFRYTYVGGNGLINLTNMFKDYMGTPRGFEVNVVSGIGWIHGFRPHMNDRYNNSVGAKTGLDFAFNLGNTKANTISLRPAIYWNLSSPGTHVGSDAFNQKGAQFYLGVAFTHHFKTSNGTYAFKTYDVGAMINEIDRLNSELSKKPTEVAVEKVIEKVVEKPVLIESKYFVLFAKGKSTLSDDAKQVLDNVKGDVDVVATASPEGDGEFNTRLSEMRAAVVADYLTNRGITVKSHKGLGVTGEESNRVAIISAVK